MATITQEQHSDILKVAAGLFNATPGNIYMDDLVAIIESGASVRNLADSLAADPLFINGMLGGDATVDNKVNVLLHNFGLTNDSAIGAIAANYFKTNLEAGRGVGELIIEAINYLKSPSPEFQSVAALLNNKVLVSNQYLQTQGAADVGELQAILSGVTATSPATQGDIAAYLNAIGVLDNPATIAPVTAEGDVLTGTAGGDLFIAGLGTFKTGDTIDGGGGLDAINATLDTTDTITPTLNSVELINIHGVGASSRVDFSASTGVQQVWNNASAKDSTVIFDNVPIATTIGIKNSQATTDINQFTDVATTGVPEAATTLTLSLAGAGTQDKDAVVQSTKSMHFINAININAMGDNYLDASAFDNVFNLTVTGTGTVNMSHVGRSELKTVDASQNTGGVTMDLSQSLEDLNITGGSGADTFKIGFLDNPVNLGAGDDTLIFKPNGLDDLDQLDGGVGFDTIVFEDGDDADMLNPTVHKNFEAMSFGGSDGGIVFDNSSFNFSRITLQDSAQGMRDTIKFSKPFSDDVEIIGAEWGGNPTGDLLDLSGIPGIDSLANLAAIETNRGLEITSSAFGGKIILVGVTLADVSPADAVL